LRLFWKLFFMLALALILTATLSTWLSRQWLLDTRDMANRLDTLAGQAETAVTLLEQEGPRAYRRWLRHAMRSHHFIGLLLEGNGKNVLPGPIPAPLRPLAGQVSRERKAIRIIRPPEIAVAMPIAAGRYYWIAATHLPPDVARRSGRQVLAIRLLASMLVILLISWLIARLIVRPLRSLQLTAEEIGRGHLDSRPAPALRSRSDELGDLARSIDTMAEQLNTLIASHKQLLRDVSHELRSPLARLQVALELARNKSGGETEEELARISSEAERLNAMIGEVLALARMEAEERPGTHSRLALDALLSDVVEDACFEAEASGKKVRLECCEKAAVHGDPALLRSALDNVIRNAIRHTPADTVVDVSLIRQKNMATIAVRDRGQGVPEEKLGRLFEPFFRTPAAGEQASDGFGLGLAIAHRAVQLHHGSIQAENHAGGGLMIRLSLPLASLPG